jgi:uncharacterized membrane protein YbhN (UPF0104 family)
MRALREGPRFYAAPAGQVRVRRATDIVVLTSCLIALAGLVAAQPPGPFEQSLLAFLETFPDWLAPVWGFLTGLLVLWSVLMLVAPLVTRRPRIAFEAVLAIALAILVGLLAARIATGTWPGGEATWGLENALQFPSVRLAAATALIVVVNAHVSRPFGSTGRWLLLFGTVGAVMNGRATVTGAVAALLTGLAAGAAVRLALGTSAGRPSLDEIRAELEALGVEVHDLVSAERQTAGVYLVYGKDAEGGDLAIKAYGRDAYDNQLLARSWRALWYRDAGSTGLARARPAEREALLTLFARSAGAPVSQVVTAGVTAGGDTLIVLRASGRPLDALSAEEIDDALLARCWAALAQLAAARVAHRQINPSSIRIAQGAVTLVDLGGGAVAPDVDERLTDQAQLLATTAAVAGSERAVRAAMTAIGTEETSALLPYLQPAALAGPLRRALKLADIDVDDLRTTAAEATGAPEPELVRITRVTWGTLVQVALLMFAGTAIVSFVGGVDFSELREDLQGASWGWIIAGAVVAQLPRLTQAVSTLGSIPVRLPFGPVYALQLATSYMNLALPSSIARMAVTVRFFQRQGVAPAVAVTSGAIDSFTGNVIQVLMLVLLLIFSSATLNLDVSAPDSSGIKDLLLLLIGIAVVVVLAVVLSRPGRRAIAAARERIRRWWPQVRGTLSALRGSHKLAQLILGNLATEILFATALGMFTRGLGYPLSLADLLVVNLSVSLFSMFIPVPGGIGVVEGGLLVGLTAAGVPESAAFASIILYRITTFYLPPVWGWFALNWLRSNRYL